MFRNIIKERGDKMNDNYVHEIVKTVIKSLYWDGLYHIISNSRVTESLNEIMDDYTKTYKDIISKLE